MHLPSSGGLCGEAEAEHARRAFHRSARPRWSPTWAQSKMLPARPLRGAHIVRRRRYLLLAGGRRRSAPPTPGNDGAHTPFPGGDVPPARDTLRATMPSAQLPGVAPAPRLQPPANHRERLRRTPTRSARSRPPSFGAPPRSSCAPASGAPHRNCVKRHNSMFTCRDAIHRVRVNIHIFR